MHPPAKNMTPLQMTVLNFIGQMEKIKVHRAWNTRYRENDKWKKTLWTTTAPRNNHEAVHGWVHSHQDWASGHLCGPVRTKRCSSHLKNLLNFFSWIARMWVFQFLFSGAEWKFLILECPVIGAAGRVRRWFCGVLQEPGAARSKEMTCNFMPDKT